MVPVPGRSTHSNAWLWHSKQNGWGGRTNVPHVVHRGAVSRPSAAASQKGCVEPSAKGSFIMAGKVPRLRSLIVIARSLVVDSVVQQRAADGQSRRPTGDDGHLGTVDLVDGHAPQLLD